MPLVIIFFPSVSVKADILTSSSKVDCFTSCGFPGHMQFFGIMPWTFCTYPVVEE